MKIKLIRQVNNLLFISKNIMTEEKWQDSYNTSLGMTGLFLPPTIGHYQGSSSERNFLLRAVFMYGFRTNSMSAAPTWSSVPITILNTVENNKIVSTLVIHKNLHVQKEISLSNEHLPCKSSFLLNFCVLPWLIPRTAEYENYKH